MAFKPSGETESELEDDTKPKTKRQKLDRWLNLVVVQTLVVILVFVDILVITSLLLINLDVIRDPVNDDRRSINKRDTDGFTGATPPARSSTVAIAENVLHIINMVIISVFLIEILLRVIGKGWDMIYDRWQVFDCLVVLVTFVLYMSLTGAIRDRLVAYCTGFLITLRLWRMARIKRDLTKPVVKQAHRIIVAHRKAVKTSEETNKKLVAKTKSLEREVQSLRDSLQNLSIVSSGSIMPQSPIRRSHMSLDTVTSEDDFDAHYNHVQTTPETVTVEVINYQRKYTPNGVLSSGTPRGSVGSFPNNNGSQPGTPISCASSTYGFDSLDGVVSDGSSGKIPDIVEDTKHPTLSRSCSRENGIGDIGLPDNCVTSSGTEAMFIDTTRLTPAPALEEEIAVEPNMNTSNNGASVPEGAISLDDSMLLAKDYADFSKELTESGIFPGSSIQNSDTSLPQPFAAEPQVIDSHIPSISEAVMPFASDSSMPPLIPDYDSSAWPASQPPIEPPVPYSSCVISPHSPLSAVAREMSATNGANHVAAEETVNSENKPSAIQTACPSQVVIRDKKSRADTVQLIKDRIRSREDLTAEDFSYLNAAFGSLTEEELNEIRRVSLVPFEYGSISVLTREGIPMTDL